MIGYKQNSKLYVLTVILVVFMILGLTIGYSSFVSTFSITNTVAQFRADANTRVTGVTTNSPYISDLDYTTVSLISSANIPSGASVVYQVTVTTYGNVPMALSNITVSNGANTISNVSVTPTLASGTYIKICDTSASCTLNKSKVVEIILTNNTGSTINTSNLSVNLTFTPFYTITYNNDLFGDTLRNGTFTHVFLSNAPTSVSVTSGSYGAASISGSTLTITNVTSDLVVSGSSSSNIGDGTYENPYRRSGSTYDTSVVQTGYNIFEDAPGAPKVNATVTTNSSGQTVTTINSFEFTSSSSSGVTFGTGASANSTLDTGVLALDGSKFSIHIKFRTNLTANKNDFVLSALQQVSSSSFSGFSLNILNSSTPYLQVSSYVAKGYSGSTLNPSQQKSVNTSSDATSNTENVYDIKMVYTPGGGQPFVATCTGSNCASGSQTLKKNSIPSSLSNARITVGGNGINNKNDMNSLTVLELHICRGTLNASYNCTLN